MGLLDRLLGRRPAVPSPAMPPAVAADSASEDPSLPAEVQQARRRIHDGLQNVVAGLGNERDKRSYTTYTLDFTTANRARLEAMHASSWLASKVVSIPAEDMTREGAKLSWDGHDDASDDSKAVNDSIDALEVWENVTEGLRWGRLYGGAGVVIGIRGQSLSDPLDMESIAAGSVENLMVYDRWWLTPTGMRDTTPGPNFGFPATYLISDPALRTAAQLVHWTRIVRFNGRPLPKTLWLANAYWDASELAHIIDNITDYDAGRAGAASMLWNASADILQLAELKEILSEPDGEAKIRQRLQTALLSMSMNRALVLDDEDKWQQKVAQFSGVKDVIGMFVLDVSGAADIPVTRLFGQSPAGLNATGESDIRNYYDHIASKRKTQLRRPLMKLLEVAVRNALGRMPKNFAITFPALWQVTATEKATIEKTNADRDAIYRAQGVITEGLIAKQLKADNVYSTMEDDDVDMAVELSLEPEVPTSKPGAPVVPPAGGKTPGAVPPPAGAAPPPDPRADPV